MIVMGMLLLQCRRAILHHIRWAPSRSQSSSNSINGDAASVISYWFPPGVSIQDLMKKWFGERPEQDSEIKRNFGGLVERARNGELEHWEHQPKSALAHIILLDQFCRNIYRGKAESFSHDPVALRIAKKLVSDGENGHKRLQLMERVFVYLPYEHSENINDQEKALELHEELVSDADGLEIQKYLQGGRKFATEHKEIIEKFGRFPRRNAALGRVNTPEEEELLANYPYSF